MGALPVPVPNTAYPEASIGTLGLAAAYAQALAAGAVGAIVPIGPLDQGTNAIQVNFTPQVGGLQDAALLLISSDNFASDIAIARAMKAGDPSTQVPLIGDYVRVWRTEATPNESGTAHCSVAVIPASPGGGPGGFWVNGGNTTGPLTGGALDASGTQVGGLSAGDPMVVDSGAGAATIVKAGHTAFLTVSIAGGWSAASANGISFGAGVAAPGNVAGAWQVQTSGAISEIAGTTWTAVGDTGVTLGSVSGPVDITANGGTGITVSGVTSDVTIQCTVGFGVSIGAGAPAPAPVANQFKVLSSRIILNGGAALTWPLTDGVAGAQSVMTTDGAGNLGFAQFQRGTSSIGAAGASAAIPANITAASRIFCFVKDFVASTAVGLEAKAASRVIGTPGSFIVTAYDAVGAAVAGANGTTFDWQVIG